MTLQIRNSKLAVEEIAKQKNAFLKEQLANFFKNINFALNKFARELDCPKETTNEEFSYYEILSFPHHEVEPDEINNYISKYISDNYKELENNNWKIQFYIDADDYRFKNKLSININITPNV